MNHQLYEDWLFTHIGTPEDPLTPQETAALQEHLTSCEACRKIAESWKEVDLQLRSEPMYAPAPGFSDRWQARWEANRQRQHQSQTLATLVFSVGGVVLLLGLFVILILPWVRSPSVLLWAGLYRLFVLYTYADVARGFLSALFQTAAGTIPFALWVISLGLLCELGVLWIVSFRLLTNPRRIMK